MPYRFLCYILFLCALTLASCDRPRGGTAAKRGTWLYMGAGMGEGKLVHGDLLRLQGKLLVLHNLVQRRDSVINLDHIEDNLLLLPIETLLLRTGQLGQYPSQLLHLDPPNQPLDTALLLSRPFTYTAEGRTYWTSFEPSYSGDNFRKRDKALDFVNHIKDYAGTEPGLEFSEYSLYTGYEQPILMLSERNGLTYGRTVAVLIDTVGTDFFGGRTFQGADSNFPDTLLFRAAPLLPGDYTAESFVAAVNSGYSQSRLLLEPEPERILDEPKRIPNRSYIDPGDLGLISASFLDDGTVMFLSDDHIILEGSYVLDLDKGLLTVSGKDWTTYHVFIDVEDGITFTLPVSVVELKGGRLAGADNYLEVDVIE
ncbi:hypothetical protein [Lewinella sp. IMCC34183]|uniref:hypothetical protein n=1 Tax=Lewinella sp. IMCC34183 TaxID=2248762 RepID=UPI000E221213|nr:hypothetical protein [Lewinella sp. IMCC34183]